MRENRRTKQRLNQNPLTESWKHTNPGTKIGPFPSKLHQFLNNRVDLIGVERRSVAEMMKRTDKETKTSDDARNKRTNKNGEKERETRTDSMRKRRCIGVAYLGIP